MRTNVITVPNNFAKMVEEAKSSKGYIIRGLLMEVGKSKQLQNDLKLMGEQRGDIERLWDTTQEEFKIKSQPLLEMAEKIGDDPTDEEKQKIDELEKQVHTLHTKIFERYESKLREILLPHQFERIDGISSYLSLRNLLPSDKNEVYWPYYLGEAMSIDSNELAALKKVTLEAKAEMEEAILKARAKAKEKVLASLSKESRSIIEGLMGERFEFIEAMNNNEVVEKLRHQPSK